MTPREALAQARKASERIQELTAAGEKLEAEHPGIEEARERFEADQQRFLEAAWNALDRDRPGALEARASLDAKAAALDEAMQKGIEIMSGVAESAAAFAEAFEVLDGVCQLQPAPDRSWLSRLFGRR